MCKKMSYLPFVYSVVIAFNVVSCQIDHPTQPTWTVDDEKESRPIKVEANLKNLLETASIRTEIESAVRHHKYVVGGEDEEKIVEEADRELGDDFRSKYGVLGALLGADEPMTKDAQAAIYKLLNVIPNQVASDLVADTETDDLFIPEYKAADYKRESDSREVLQINKVEADLGFWLGEGVREWKVYTNGDLLGISATSLILAQKRNDIYQQVKTMNFDGPIQSLETLTLWNKTSQTTSNIVVVSQDSSILWVNTADMFTFWEWPFGAKVQAIKYFESEDSHFLAMQSLDKLFIYQFDHESAQLWLIQTIPIESSPTKIELLDLGYQKLLIVPQSNQITIFKTDQLYKGHLHFVKTSPITTANNPTIHTFQMGGYSYLAVGGDHPTIYRYHYGTFRPQTILDPNFGFVDQFLAIPCQTYRDDLILLVQHRVDFETHSLSVVEALIWNGEAFEATKSVPCKIGETIELFGVNCLLDIDRNEGLKGAVVVGNSDGQVSVVVPRYEAPSGLFRISTELIPKRSEIDDLEQILWQMESIVADQEKTMQMLEDQVWSLGKLRTQQLVFGGDVDTIYLNNEEWTNEDREVDIDQLLADLEIIHKELDEIERDMTVEEVTVKDLFIENFNGHPFEELREIHHNGTIVVEGDLIGNVYYQRVLLKEENDRNIGMLDLVEIEGDLEFSEINGIAWDEFMGQVVYKDESSELSYLKVEKLMVDTDLNVGLLNNLSFPGDFLLSSGPKTSIITGKKTFLNMLNANAMDCEGTINNVKPSDFITLNQEQNITGITTFSQLEVSKSFEIHGTISGKDLGSYINNPTLLETVKLDAECQFHKLVVDGPVIIRGFYNKRKFDDILDDVVYISEQNVMINSTKIFKEIQFDDTINLASNQINDINLDEFVTKSTDQILDITEIEGDVFIKNLQLGGLFNSVNVTAMDLNSIRLDEQGLINTTLIFADPEFLQADTLEVLQTLNNIPVHDFISINDPIFLKNVTMNLLDVDHLNVSCDIDGQATLNAINLTKFNEDRFSLSQNQTIRSDVIADQVIIDGDFVVKTINNFPIEYLLEILSQSGNISATLQSAKHLTILGNVTVSSIDGMSTDDLWSKVIWLDRPNTINDRVQFLDKVIFQDDLTLESNLLNKKNFEDFLNDLVLHKDGHVYVQGPKKFTKSIQVLQDATIDMFNDIPAAQLATKVRPMKIEGDLGIMGDLELHSLDMEGEKFGEFDVQQIFDTYQYDSSNDMHYINGRVEFSGKPVMNELFVGSSINGLEGPNELFKNIVYKNMSTEIKGRKTFNNKVQFDDGLFVGHLNGVNVVEFFDNVVYVSEEQPVEVNYPVTFSSPVTAQHVYMRGPVYTDIIMGCKVKDWLDNCLRIDQPATVEAPLYFGPGTLNGNNLRVSHINGLPTSKLFTLNTPQTFSENISLPYLYLDTPVVVKDTVNGMDIVHEYKNTFKISGNQHITTPIEAHSIQVLHNMETLEPIDGRDLREVATLHDDLVFRSSLTFKHIQADHLYTDDYISGLNFTEWYHTSLKANTSENQIITGEWSVDELYINSKTVTIKPPVKAGNITDLMSLGKTLREDYTDVCRKTMQLRQQTAERVSFVKYLKKDLELVRQKPIDAMHSIEFFDSTLILINEGCISKVYQWNLSENRFKRIAKIETGSVDDVEVLGNHIFATHSLMQRQTCSFLGSKYWKVNGKDVTLERLARKSNSDQEVYRYKKKTRCSRAVKENYPNFDAPIDRIAMKMIDELQPLQSTKGSDFPFVASSFGDSVKDVATKLWTGLTQLDDVKTIIHHATKIYHSLSDTSEQDHQHTHSSTGSEGESRGGHSDSDSADKLLGAEGPAMSSIRPNSSKRPPTSQSITAVQRLQTILDVIPLGFGDLVGSARSPVNDHDFESQLRRLVTGITKAFHSAETRNLTVPSKRSLELAANVSKSLEILRQFAEGASELEDIYTNYESVDETDPIYFADIAEGHDEAITFHVGSKENRRQLIAVISPIDYHSIRLYFHSLEGDVFQIIQTRRPYKLTSLEIQDETILAFIDYYNIIRVMKYKGVEGFVEWSSFRAESEYPVSQLVSLSLLKSSSVCRSYYLVSAWAEHIQFYEVVIGGMCPVKATVETCDGWW